MIGTAKAFVIESDYELSERAGEEMSARSGLSKRLMLSTSYCSKRYSNSYANYFMRLLTGAKESAEDWSCCSTQSRSRLRLMPCNCCISNSSRVKIMKSVATSCSRDIGMSTNKA